MFLFKVKFGVKVFFVTSILAAIFAIIYFYRNSKTANIIVKIDNAQENNFIGEAEVLALLSEEHIDLQNVKVDKLNLKNMENAIKNYQFVADCQVSRDLKGNIIVKVKQQLPLARVFRQNTTTRGGYIAENGLILPLSKRYTARVLLMTGAGTENFFENDYFNLPEGKELMKMLHFIHEQEFWKAQIVQIDIDQQQNLTLFTQIGNQEILFGKIDDFVGKFQKLQTFYKKIIPAKGWNTYKKINLKFENQIICD